MIDKDFVGAKTNTRYCDVEAGRLRLFAVATGEDDPVYLDEKAAIAAGHPALPAPPTFMFCLGMIHPAEKNAIEHMVDSIGEVLHGEQGFEYFKMIYAGDRIAITTTTVAIDEKKGGHEVVRQVTEAINQHGELCAKAYSSIVIPNRG
ncbi:MaoC family dehydratase N-terminal domain-containing protein [Maricurvus nonylphenolicus]|uniref:MaoC family dehydratase N-terminal domain-containing protein n=1 Tax=Maricurvus nonylphenolicus TaxID=1008307 RepID=UPI0036F43F29